MIEFNVDVFYVKNHKTYDYMSTVIDKFLYIPFFWILKWSKRYLSWQMICYHSTLMFDRLIKDLLCFDSNSII